MRGAGFFFATGTMIGFFVGRAYGYAVWGTMAGIVAGLVATALLNWFWSQRR
jgi:hypothetical protein